MSTIDIGTTDDFVPVNLWDEPLGLIDLRHILAMVVQQCGFTISRHRENGLLYIGRRGMTRAEALERYPAKHNPDDGNIQFHPGRLDRCVTCQKVIGDSGFFIETYGSVVHSACATMDVCRSAHWTPVPSRVPTTKETP